MRNVTVAIAMTALALSFTSMSQDIPSNPALVANGYLIMAQSVPCGESENVIGVMAVAAGVYSKSDVQVCTHGNYVRMYIEGRRDRSVREIDVVDPVRQNDVFGWRNSVTHLGTEIIIYNRVGDICGDRKYAVVKAGGSDYICAKRYYTVAALSSAETDSDIALGVFIFHDQYRAIDQRHPDGYYSISSLILPLSNTIHGDIQVTRPEFVKTMATDWKQDDVIAIFRSKGRGTCGRSSEYRLVDWSRPGGAMVCANLWTAKDTENLLGPPLGHSGGQLSFQP